MGKDARYLQKAVNIWWRSTTPAKTGKYLWNICWIKKLSGKIGQYFVKYLVNIHDTIIGKCLWNIWWRRKIPTKISVKNLVKMQNSAKKVYNANGGEYFVKYLVTEECTSCNWLTCPRQPQRKRGIHFHIFFYIFQKPTVQNCTPRY